MPERQIEIVIKGKNLTAADFAAARKDLADLKKETEGTAPAATSLGNAFSLAGKGLALAGVAGTALAAGLAVAAKEIADLGARGADIADVSTQFDVLNRSIGNNADSLKGTLRGAFAGTISDFDTMQAVNKGLSQGLKLSEDQFGLTAKASRVLADRIGGDTKEAFDVLTMAMATGQDKQLKTIGLNIDAEASVAQYANSLGKEKSALSESETQTAKKNAILAELQRVLKQSGEAELDFADRVAQAKTVLHNFEDQIAVGIASSPVLSAGMDAIGQAFTRAFGPNQTQLVDLVVAGVNKLALFLVDAGIYAVEFGKVGVQAFGMLATPIGLLVLGIQKLESGFVAVIDTIGQTGAHLPGVGAQFKALADVAATMQGQLRAGISSTNGFIDATHDMANGQGLAMAVLNKTGDALVNVKAAMVGASMTVDQKRVVTEQDTRANRDNADSLGDVSQAAEEADPNILRLTESFRKQIEAHEKLKQTLDEVAPTPESWRLPQATFALEGVKQLTNGLEPLRAGFKDTATVAREAAEVTEAKWKRTGDAFGDVASILDHLPGKFFEIAGVAARTGKAIADNLAKGDTFGAVIAGVTGVATAFGKLFTDKNKQEVQKYNAEIGKVHDSLLQQYGDMANLEAAANRVGLSFQEAWGHQGKAGLEATNKMAEELEQRLKAVDAANALAIGGFTAVVTGITKPWTELGKSIDQATTKAQEAGAAYQTALSNGAGADELARLKEAADEASISVLELHTQAAHFAVDGKQQLADLGLQAVGTFGASMVAGKTYSEAMAAIGPSIATLGESYKTMGLDVEDVGLKHLILQSTVAKGNPELIAATSGLGDSMQGLAQLGMLNVDTFGAMQRTGAAMYTRLQAQVGALGGDTRDALLPMQGYLQEAAAQAQLLGYPLDDNTQRLIDQSKELGIWKDKGKSAQDLLIDGMKTMVDKVDELLTKMMGFSGALASVPNRRDIEINVTENVTRNVTTNAVGGDDPDWGGAQASGGDYWVTRPTLFLAGEAGPERATFSPSRQNGDAGAGGSSAAATMIPAPNVYIVNDSSGARQVTEAEFTQIQSRLDNGGLLVPARSITQRTR